MDLIPDPHFFRLVNHRPASGRIFIGSWLKPHSRRGALGEVVLAGLVLGKCTGINCYIMYIIMLYTGSIHVVAWLGTCSLLFSSIPKITHRY